MDEPFRDICHTTIIVSQISLILEKIFLRNLYVFGISLEELKEDCEHFQFHRAESDIIYIMNDSSNV